MAAISARASSLSLLETGAILFETDAGLTSRADLEPVRNLPGDGWKSPSPAKAAPAKGADASEKFERAYPEPGCVMTWMRKPSVAGDGEAMVIPWRNAERQATQVLFSSHEYGSRELSAGELPLTLTAE